MVRGRPRQFDIEEAIDKSLIVFWEKGFAGASLTDLTSAMGINGPSLYAAFGDKQSLYLQCVDRYIATFGAEPARCLQDADDIEDALTEFFLAIIDNISGQNAPPGCLMACTLAETALTNADIAEKLRECIAKTDALLQTRLERAAAAGQLQPGADPVVLAKIANSFRHGMTLRARSGAERSILVEQANQMVHLLLGQAMH